jgi:putative DNA primase/helicase
MGKLINGPFRPQPPHVDPPEVQLADAMRKVGIDPPPNIQIDGQLHRFSTKGRARDDSGWYIVFPDEPIAGRFGCWRDQIDAPFRADVGRELTVAEQMISARRQNEARERRDAERKRKAEVAASTVEAIWANAIAPSPDHPYLKRKGIQAHGARLTGDGRLIVPLFLADGSLSSVQYIGDEKRYHPGAVTRGCSWTLGEIDDGTIFVAEGFATAATIHEVSNRPVVIAYSANNLPTIVGQLREQHGDQRDLVIVADNDASGVGRNKADEAAARYGARIVMPPELGDANDYHLAGHDLHALLFPPSDGWLDEMDAFSEQPAPVKWLIKHWAQADSMMMVHGPSGGGKTFLVLDMALSIASMGAVPAWQGNKVYHGPVVYLAGEGHHGLRGRVAAWKQHRGIKKLRGWISKHGVDLNTAPGYQKAADAIRALPEPPTLIVVDTLHRFLAGDENSAQDAKTMIDACGGLMKEFGCSVLLVHHTGVAAEAQHRARGSSAWKGALDIEISVVPPDDRGGPIQVIQRKSKDAEMAEPINGALEVVEIAGWFDDDGEKVTSAVFVEGEEVQPQESSALARHKKTFERAWWAGHAQVSDDGRPYVAREDLIEKLIEDGNSAAYAKNQTKPSHTNRLIGALINSEQIAPESAGWAVIDNVWASALLLAKKG